MPPWLPESPGLFDNERRLSSDQIETIAKWVREGSPAGKQSATPDSAPIAIAEDASSGKPDLVLQVPGFTIPADGAGHYLEFPLKAAVDGPRWVRAINIQSGNDRAVRQVSLFVTANGRSSQESGNSGTPLSAATVVGFWLPGLTRSQSSEGAWWKLSADTRLTVRVYVQPTGKPERVEVALGMYFTDTPPSVRPVFLGLKGEETDIPPQGSEFLVSDDFRLPMDVELTAVYPDAGALGRVLQVYATLPDGTLQWLLRIPSWDPNWQEGYRYKKRIVLPRGTIVSMRYRYDNGVYARRGPGRSFQKVHVGDGPGDEPARLWLKVLPANRITGQPNLSGN
jgi:hypothetical protein